MCRIRSVSQFTGRAEIRHFRDGHHSGEPTALSRRARLRWRRSLRVGEGIKTAPTSAARYVTVGYIRRSEAHEGKPQGRRMPDASEKGRWKIRNQRRSHRANLSLARLWFGASSSTWKMLTYAPGRAASTQAGCQDDAGRMQCPTGERNSNSYVKSPQFGCKGMIATHRSTTVAAKHIAVPMATVIYESSILMV